MDDPQGVDDPRRAEDPLRAFPAATGPGATGGERRRLDRAPGERYGVPVPASATPADGVSGGRVSAGEVSAGGVSARGVSARGVGIAAGVAAVGGAVFFVLGQLGLGAGLLAVAAFTGWITAVALVDPGWGAGVGPGPRRIAVAASLAVGAILAAMLVDWAWAGVQGGVLGPLDYIAERYGAAAVLDLGAAGLLAGLRAR